MEGRKREKEREGEKGTTRWEEQSRERRGGRRERKEGEEGGREEEGSKKENQNQTSWRNREEN